MKILDRYVLWNFLKNYLISFMVLVGMYIVLDMVFNFDELVDLKGGTDAGGVHTVLGSIGNIADYYFYQSFFFFVQLSGIIPVVAAAFTLMRLSRFNELTAVLAAGVPLLRVAMPIIIAGVVLNGLMIADQEILIPRIIHKLTREHEDLTRVEGDGKAFMIQAMQDNNRSLLYAARYTPPAPGQPASMENVDIVERVEVERPVEQRGPDGRTHTLARKVIEAKAHVLADKAVWNAAEQRWDLSRRAWNPFERRWEQRGGLKVWGLGADDDDPISRPEEVDFYQSNINPEEVALFRSGDWVEMLSTSRIDQLIARPGSYGQANLLRVKHWRFTQPIMNVILLLLAIPCVLTREPGHLKTAVTKCLFLTGLGMGAVFLAHQIAGHPPEPSYAHAWPALLAWVPIFIFGPLAVFLLDRVKT